MDKKSIKSETSRDELAVRREPYWDVVDKGLYVGYRVSKNGGGTWIARYRNAEKKQVYESLGDFAAFPSKDRFVVACNAARAWHTSTKGGKINADYTVADACLDYANNLATTRTETAAHDNRNRFKRLVNDTPLGKMRLVDLTSASRVRSWLNAQVLKGEDLEAVRRSKDTANRNLTALKAALNLAYNDGKITTNEGWRSVKAFRDVGERRKGVMSFEDRKTLLAALPSDLSPLFRAFLLTAIRPGALAKLTVGAFDSKEGTLHITEGKAKTRIVPVSTEAVKLFCQHIQGKTKGAPLIARADGSAWNKDQWKKVLKKTLEKAGLPTESVAYDMRHTAISEMILGGINPAVVAKLAGTSTAMIDKHYGHLLKEKTRALLDSVKVA